MSDETKSDRFRLCHPPHADGSHGLPSGDWCRLATELWWGFAIQFPAAALAEIGEAGQLPPRAPGEACPIAGCGRHGPHDPPVADSVPRGGT